MTLAQLTLLAVETIADVIQAVRDAREGRVTPDQAGKRISDMRDALRRNDAQADTELDRKFTEEG